MNTLPLPLLKNIIEPLSVWYEENRKSLPWRESNSPYHIWLSEVMLQQTRTTAVIPYYHRFITALPTVSALAEVEDDVLMKLWEGLGYYSRARNLKAAAKQIVDIHGGELPQSYKELLSLPGIGEYTAGAIASIAFGLPEPAVDGNVLRVMMRLCACEMDIALPETKKAVTDALRHVYPSGRAASILTEGIMELGENVCIPNGRPHCIDCPLAGFCQGLAQNKVDELPKKSPKKARRIEQKTVLLLEYEGTVGIRKRQSKGLLAGLWEFPSLPGNLTEQQVIEEIKKEGLAPVSCRPCGTAVHIFTHVEWHMSGFRVTLASPSPKLIAATPDQLTHQYAIPKAFSFFRNQYRS